MSFPPIRTRPAPRVWLMPLLIVLLVAVPIAEVYLLIQVGQQIGLLPTIGILILEAVLGAWLTRREGDRAWKALNAAFTSGQMPTGQLADAALVLVGGVMLMLPGFITDIVGLLFLLPFTRQLARRLLAAVIARRIDRSGLGAAWARHDHSNLVEGETIAGETIPDSASTPRTPGSSRSESASGPIVISGEIDDGRG